MLWLIIMLVPFLYASTPSEPEKVHGMWFRPPADSVELIQSLEKMKNLGINTIFIETFYHSWTIYPSENTYQRPEFLGWDPLAMTLKVAHANNMEVHAWLEVFYAYNPDYLDGTYGPILSEHPDWLLESNDPADPFAEDGKLFFNPAHPSVQLYLLTMMKELMMKYPIDGINLDYIRYPVHSEEKQFGFDPVSRSLFYEETGVELSKESIKNDDVFRRFAAWKIKNVTKFVEKTACELKTMNPNIQLSAAVFPSYQNDPQCLSKFQDWATWVKGDMMDFITPMCYGHIRNIRQQEIRESLELSRVPVVIGLSINRVETSQDVEALIKDGFANGLSAGIAWFAYNWINPVFLETVTHFFTEAVNEK
ncbi:MAG: family 10 glycosylhydrolase [Candidatus Marinimicrobia bacterium]|nr:family 10 glycosylhydrolase [Candidatus Neomarinimicrobiota bacterium]